MMDNQTKTDQVLYPSKLKWGLVSLVGLLFVGMGIILVMNGKGELKAWLSLAFFTLVLIVGLIQFFGKGSYLTLTSEGFQVSHFGKKHSFQLWQDCSNFKVKRIGFMNKLVVYNRHQDSGKLMGAINRTISGGSVSLPDTYGLKAEKLASLMNAYQKGA